MKKKLKLDNKGKKVVAAGREYAVKDMKSADSEPKTKKPKKKKLTQTDIKVKDKKMEHLKTFKQFEAQHPFDDYTGPSIVPNLADRLAHNMAADGSDGVISSARPGGEFGGQDHEPTSTPAKRRWKYNRTPRKKPSKKRLSAIKKILALQKDLDAKKVKDD